MHLWIGFHSKTQWCWKYVLYSSPPSQSQRQIKWHWNQIQIQWCIIWKQAHGTYSTCTARWKSARTILYHQTDSDSWYRICLAVFKRVSVMQTDRFHSFIHGDVHDDGWMREYSITLKNDVEKRLFQCRSIMLYSAHTTVQYWQYKYTWRTTQQEEQQNKSNEIAIL